MFSLNARSSRANKFLICITETPRYLMMASVEDRSKIESQQLNPISSKEAEMVED